LAKLILNTQFIMKRILFILALYVFGFNYLNAQEGTSAGGLDYKGLENKLEKSNKTIEDPKKNINPKTWIDRAKLFQNIAEVNSENLRLGMSANEVKIFYKEPKEIQKSDGKEQYIYEHFNVILENGNVKGWVETQKIHPKPLEEALACYNKAIELDAEGKNGSKIAEGLKKLKEVCEKSALNFYNLQDYKNSVESFKEILNINEMKQINITDTTTIFYTGIAAFDGDMKDEAIKYLQKAAELNFKDPSMYVRLSKLYLAKTDSTAALNTLQKGIVAYPDNVSILVELINYYIAKGESQKTLEFLDKAKKNDPKNQTFYFVEGVLYDKTGNMEKSVEAYNKAIEIDPNYFDAYYNLGVIYFNYAVKLVEEANKELDNSKYLEKKNKADEEFKKVIPYMEKAYDIAKQKETPDAKPNQKQSLETLKTLYYRLKMNDQLERVNQLLQEFQ
jgi:tetratricopeptide (TPR) repeat protein